jgi:hypothetical protein
MVRSGSAKPRGVSWWWRHGAQSRTPIMRLPKDCLFRPWSSRERRSGRDPPPHRRSTIGPCRKTVEELHTSIKDPHQHPQDHERRKKGRLKKRRVFRHSRPFFSPRSDSSIIDPFSSDSLLPFLDEPERRDALISRERAAFLAWSMRAIEAWKREETGRWSEVRRTARS